MAESYAELHEIQSSLHLKTIIALRFINHSCVVTSGILIVAHWINYTALWDLVTSGYELPLVQGYSSNASTYSIS